MAYYDDPRYVRRDADRSLTVPGRRQPIDWTAEGPSELSPVRIDRRNPDHSSAGISIQRRSHSPVGRSSARRPARRHRSPSSSTDYSSPERIVRQENVQAIFSPDFDQKDVTLHFTMDIAEDIEGALEELARLKRLGHFKEAQEYVATHLDHHLNLPLVAIEYADLLRQQGAHRQLHDLRNRRHLLPPLKSKFIFGTDMKPPNLYRTHFELIEQSSELALQGLPRKQVLLIKNENILRYLNKRVPSWFISAYVRPNEDVSLDSTEVWNPSTDEQCELGRPC
ncbi:hypothetical protein NUU61_008141 [Penicillium alfredii]|uniref:Uncharacterized protein n=1 Tax=Penicillium alfredii TaxID=1506179 RepID=A0A9W9JYP9_9EURO|nr:uncharacterized protein NUU61_008141 [Penicillium alfredii]KAJ5086834.1 hypothetical protein NUU61_008141 [Penicillium alfredii]